MKENPRKILNRLKRNITELEAQKLSEGLESPNVVVVAATLNELRKLKDPFHMHRGVELLSNSSDSVVIAALKYLNAVEHPLSFEDVVPLLKRSLKIRREVAKIARLMEYGQACKLLENLIKDPSPEVRIAVLHTISEIGCEKVVQDVKEAVNDANSKVSIAAIETLAELGEDVESEALTETVLNVFLPDRVRLKALKIYVKNSVSPLEFLEKVSDSSYPPLSSKALELMGEMECDKTWETFKKVLSNKGNIPSRICSAFNGVLRGCKDETEIENVAINYLDHPSSKVKLSAFKVVMKADSVRAAEIVNDFLKSENSDLVKAATPFIYKYPDEDNIQMLRSLIEKGDEKTIVPALKIFKKLKLRDESISKYLDRNYPTNVRVQALKALIATNGISDEELKKIVTSNEPLEFRITALDGLAAIAPEKLLELEE